MKPAGGGLARSVLSFPVAECLNSSTESLPQQWTPDKIKAFSRTPYFVLSTLFYVCTMSRLIKFAFRYQQHSFGLPIFKNCEPNKSIFDKFQSLRYSMIETPSEFQSNPRREASQKTVKAGKVPEENSESQKNSCSVTL